MQIFTRTFLIPRQRLITGRQVEVAFPPAGQVIVVFGAGDQDQFLRVGDAMLQEDVGFGVGNRGLPLAGDQRGRFGEEGRS
jgi:hypothetical protein